ncbi:MAG: tRNA (N6-threonylcarbamoyladenosine(37)-N6)-methyltransferase TrmO [Desulfobacteraceae bacterium]|nr:MAG: tRNA (N6-threonylcarbamoyladenosine(37)-N6)-methyltransferase TrmO [Desulfobacteraceae bacterium]
MNDLNIQPIGVIETPFENPEGMPIQPEGALGVEGRLIIDPVFEEGLNDIDGFSHLILLYYFHRSSGYDLMVTPFMDNTQRGVFSTRAPRRPSQIGFSVVRLLKREGPILFIRGIDVLCGTPLLDIKPYVPKFDAKDAEAVGWLETHQHKVARITSDSRFSNQSQKTDNQ